jgi:aminoglycoside phosphotransferase (APT) family kinase protein
MTRDLRRLEDGFARWLRHRWSDDRPATVRAELVTGGGYSNDVVFVDVGAGAGGVAGVGGGAGWPAQLVLRLPPEGPGLFRTYDLAMQAAVQDAARRGGVPVPSFVEVEPDVTWVGAPFLVMPRVAGAVPGELPVADDWIMGLGPAGQRTLHEAFLDALARVHASPVDGLAHHLRGGTPATPDATGAAGAVGASAATPGAAGAVGAAGTVDASGPGALVAEVDWWRDLVDWTFDGATPASLADGFAWCRARVPDPAPPAGLLWGDVRLGNVVFGADLGVRAVLDWEMASLGPAESDLAWCTALDEIAAGLVGQQVPGFLARDEIVDRHERALGRQLAAFRWFEIFAMLRAAALNVRTATLAAARTGKPARPPERDLVVRHCLGAIDAAP